jgi:hypothetical protein
MGQIPAHIQYSDYSVAKPRRRFALATPILIGAAIGLVMFVAALVVGLVH